MPGEIRRDRGDYARVLFIFCTRGCGRDGRPAFPAPSDFGCRYVQGKTRADARRDREAVSREPFGCLKFQICRAHGRIMLGEAKWSLRAASRGYLLLAEKPKLA